jgi:ABC-type phosphate/phosphonate transport system substrate-binding protein
MDPIRRRMFLATAAVALGLPSVARADGEFVFAVNEGVTYRVTPHETRERYRELGDLVGKVLKQPVKLVPVDQYPVLQQNLAAKVYDLAYVHPSHHALRAMREQGYRLIAVTKGFTEYKARFLVKKDAPLKDAKQIQGQKMVMPDPDSITAWMTRATLRELGLDAAKEQLGTTRYQDGIPFMMENGFYDVGITASGAVVKEWTAKGGRVLFESRPVPIKLLIASPKVPAADVERLRELFLGLDRDKDGQAALAKIGFNGFVPGDEKQLAEAARWLGL